MRVSGPGRTSATPARRASSSVAMWLTGRSTGSSSRRAESRKNPRRGALRARAPSPSGCAACGTDSLPRMLRGGQRLKSCAGSIPAASITDIAQTSGVPRDADCFARGEGPELFFKRTRKSPTIDLPIHLDLNVPDREAEVNRIIGLGAKLVETKTSEAGELKETFTVLRDPEG